MYALSKHSLQRTCEDDDDVGYFHFTRKCIIAYLYVIMMAFISNDETKKGKEKLTLYTLDVLFSSSFLFMNKTTEQSC